MPILLIACLAASLRDMPSWLYNCDILAHNFDVPTEMRNIIYTTTSGLHLNLGIRQYTPANVRFADDLVPPESVIDGYCQLQKNGACPSNTGDMLHQC